MSCATESVCGEGEAGHFPLQKAAGIAELMVFYCEQAAGFCNDIGYRDESYLNALVRMFEQALTVTSRLVDSQSKGLLERLDRTRTIAHNLG